MQRIVLYAEEPVLAAGARQIFSEGFDLMWCASFAQLQASALDSTDILLFAACGEDDNPNLSLVSDFAHRCRMVLWACKIPPELAHQYLRRGVSGIISRTAQIGDQLGGLKKVADGETYFGLDLRKAMLALRHVPLTQREGRLVECLARKMKNPEIATTLDLGEGTVKVYISRLLPKLKTEGRGGAILIGSRNLGQKLGKFDPLLPPIRMIALPAFYQVQ